MSIENPTPAERRLLDVLEAADATWVLPHLGSLLGDYAASHERLLAFYDETGAALQITAAITDAFHHHTL